MKLSKTGLELIKKYEGLRLLAYDDMQPGKTITDKSQIKGTLTIGYGHTGGVTVGQTITRERAEAYLKDDVATAEQAVNAIERDFNQNQFDALVSFTYNCGAGNLRTLCKNRDVDTIGEKLILYTKSCGKELAGLVTRRKEEQKLYRTPAGLQAGGAILDVTPDCMPVIRKGDRGEAVRKMQQALLNQNFKSCIIREQKKYLKADGIWGEITDSIFRRWQGYKGLKADGICGPKSWRELGFHELVQKRKN